MNEETKVIQIVEQMKNGYEKGFADFYSQTYKYVYSRAKCMFSDEQEAADLTQEVYLAAYRNINSLKGNESIFGWLRTITFYQGTKMLKKKRKELLLSEENEELFETIADEEEVENDYMEKQDIEIIRACINRLSEEQKAAILAYYYDNLKVDEIAKLMELSEGTVKSRLYLARKNLKGFIEEEEKKQGYKLHSFGPVTLAFVLRSMLQENMELAGVREAGIFASVCQELNLVLGTATKKGILGAIAGIGAKKIAISAVALIGAVVIGGASIVALTKKDDKPEKATGEETKIEERVEEDVVEVQQWQKDYAKILMELLYLPVDATTRNEGWNEVQTPQAGLEWLFICASEETVYFGLMDISEDGIPELFVKTVCDETVNRYYMFTTGDSIEECYLTRVNYVDTDTNEIIRLCRAGVETSCTVIYTFDGKELKEEFVFGENDNNPEQTLSYEYYASGTFTYSEHGEQMTKEKYDELLAQYSKEDQFSLETHELSLENIESQLGVRIPSKYISIYQHIRDIYDQFDVTIETREYVMCDEIYFNNDDQPDYVLSYSEFYFLLVSGEDAYYKIEDLSTGTYSSSYSYIEKTGKLLRFATGVNGAGWGQDIYQLNELYELVSIGYYGEDYKRDVYGMPIINSETGEYDVIYEYYMGDVREELSQEEWNKKVDALSLDNQIELGATKPLSELFLKIELISQSAGEISKSKDDHIIEKATHFVTASASSTLPEEGKYNYSPTNVLTQDASCWVEGASGYGEGEWIKLELPEKQLLSGLKIINGYAGGTAKQYAYNSKITDVLIEFSDGQSTTKHITTYIDEYRNTVQTIEFNKPIETSYVKITIKNVLAGECQDTCLTYVAPF